MRRRQRLFFAIDIPENSIQAIVVARRNRIELVIVATRATGGQSEHGDGGCADDIVQLIVEHALLVFLRIAGLNANSWTGSKESGSDQRALVLRLVFIACKLPAYESVKRHVLIHRLDDEIPIAVDGRPVLVVLVPFTVRVARQIKPMARPALPEIRARQQFLDQLLFSGGRRVLDEKVDVLKSRRQADKIV